MVKRPRRAGGGPGHRGATRDRIQRQVLNSYIANLNAPTPPLIPIQVLDVGFQDLTPTLPFYHSITRCARISTAGGIVTPRALAVFTLITSSNFVAC